MTVSLRVRKPSQLLINMLLRRITEHVKSQNWFAVGLDFTIVVLGILIAFQITSWNEDRRERVLERQVLSRLLDDYRALSVETQEKLAHHETALSKFPALEESISAPTLPGVQESLSDFFTTGFSLLQPAGQSDTYLQLVSSGDMSLISNEVLRTQVAAHENLTEQLAAADQARREWSRAYVSPLVRLSVLYDRLPIDEAISLASSKDDMIMAISMHHDIFEGQVGILNDHLEAFNALVESLSKELGIAVINSTAQP